MPARKPVMLFLYPLKGTKNTKPIKAQYQN